MLDLIDRLSIFQQAKSVNTTQVVRRPAPPLRSPAQVSLRPARLDDAAELTDLITGLSATSKYFRFLGGLGQPSPALLARLLRRDASHGAWLAVIDQMPVGHVMWALVDDAVEPGVVVADAWQQRGIGRRLVQAALAEATVAGAVAVQVDVHIENRFARAMIERALPDALITREAELLTFRAPMAAALAAEAASTRPLDNLYFL
jgi:GNAT superfamily N-acetyltransferase